MWNFFFPTDTTVVALRLARGRKGKKGDKPDNRPRVGQLEIIEGDIIYPWPPHGHGLAPGSAVVALHQTRTSEPVRR